MSESTVDPTSAAKVSSIPATGAHTLPRLQLIPTPLPAVVTLVAAAGYGKTTAAASIVSASKPVSAWISLDKRRRDLHSFWLDTVRALLPLTGPVDIRPLMDLAAGDDPDAVDELVRAVVTGLAKSGQRSVIGFDDVHELGEPAQQSLFDLIKMASPHASFVLTSRQQLHWDLAETLPAGAVVAIGTGDLAFDIASTRQSLQLAATDGLVDVTVVETVHQQTEGWPLAVGLTADALRRTGSASGASVTDAAAAGVLDWLARSIEPEQLEVLSDLSICSSFDTNLAAAVSETAADIDLGLLAEQSSVMVAVPAPSDTYRLHRLVGDLLSERLQSTDPDKWRQLHQRAADWHRDRGDRSQEIEHRLRAEQYSVAAEVLIASSGDFVVPGRLSMLLEWIRRMPDAFVAGNPRLVTQLSEILAARGEVDESRRLLRQASQSVRGTHHELWVMGARIFVDWSVGNARSAAAEFEALCTAVERHARDGESAGFRIQHQMASLVGLCHETIGQPDQARRLHTWLDHRSASHPSLWSNEIIHGVMARQLAVDGYMALAAERARLTLTVNGSEVDESVMHADAHVALAHVGWAAGDLDAANRSLVLAAQLDLGWTELFATVRRVLAAQIAVSSGRFDRAEEVLADAFNKGIEAEASDVVGAFIARHAVEILAATGRDNEARSWASKVSDGSVESAPASAWASYQSAVGNSDAVIDRFHASGIHLPQQPLPYVRTGLILTRSLYESNRHSNAATLLLSVLAVAEEHRLIQPLKDAPIVGELLESDQTGGLLSAFTHLIEDETSLAEPVSKSDAVQLPFGQTFSPRQLDLLPLLPSRASNRQIADELYVSLNTVKSHLKAIYRKLDVSSRDEAVERCTELGLLSAASLSQSS